MQDDYHAWADAELVKDHEADPSQFQKIQWPTSSSPNYPITPSTAQSDSFPEAEHGLSVSECS
jgi:hypothetical protein